MIDLRIAWFAIGAIFGFVLYDLLLLLRWLRQQRCSRLRRHSRKWRNNYQGFPPAPPRPGYRRVYFNSPTQVAECGGPCEAGPEHCNCGALWRDDPIQLDPGSVQRGNGNGGPTTPKPNIIPRGTRSITFPDPTPDRQPTNPFTGEPVQSNQPPTYP